MNNGAFDLLRTPLLGRLLRWRHARTFFQIPLLLLSVLMILHGFFGPSLAPKNLATTLTWVHFRGALVSVAQFRQEAQHVVVDPQVRVVLRRVREELVEPRCGRAARGDCGLSPAGGASIPPALRPE